MLRRGCRVWDKRLDTKPSSGQPACAASPAAEWLGAAADRAATARCCRPHRIRHPDIFAVGDTVVVDGPMESGARHCAGGQAAGTYVADVIKAGLRGDTPAVPLQACRQPGADRQAEAVIDFGASSCRHAGLVDLGHRAHLLSDRPAHRLSVAMSWLWVYTRDQPRARLITQGSSKGSANDSGFRFQPGHPIHSADAVVFQPPPPRLLARQHGRWLM